VLWIYQRRDKRWTKVPLSPRSGTPVSARGGVGWADLAGALDGQDRFRADGVGFVFRTSDPHCGIDLDDCRDPATGELLAWAQEIVESFDTYTEVSPSGRRRCGLVEMYDAGRYFTVTGARLRGVPRLIEERQEQLETLHARLFGDGQAGTPVPAPRPPRRPDGPSLHTAERLVRAALDDPARQELARLWRGEDGGHPSDSEADFALCRELARLVGPHPVLIEQLVRRSGRLRAKWDEPRGELTYGQLTVRRALESRAVPAWVPAELRSAWACDIAPEQLDWLWPGWLARGKLAVLEGDPGLGKSTLTMDLAARVSTGRPLVGEPFPGAGAAEEGDPLSPSPPGGRIGVEGKRRAPSRRRC
jgi:primase-polymerase (primpol)-like protein